MHRILLVLTLLSSWGLAQAPVQVRPLPNTSGILRLTEPTVGKTQNEFRTNTIDSHWICNNCLVFDGLMRRCRTDPSESCPVPHRWATDVAREHGMALDESSLMIFETPSLKRSGKTVKLKPSLPTETYQIDLCLTHGESRIRRIQ